MVISHWLYTYDECADIVVCDDSTVWPNHVLVISPTQRQGGKGGGFWILWNQGRHSFGWLYGSRICCASFYLLCEGWKTCSGWYWEWLLCVRERGCGGVTSRLGVRNICCVWLHRGFAWIFVTLTQKFKF